MEWIDAVTIYQAVKRESPACAHSFVDYGPGSYAIFVHDPEVAPYGRPWMLSIDPEGDEWTYDSNRRTKSRVAMVTGPMDTWRDGLREWADLRGVSLA